MRGHALRGGRGRGLRGPGHRGPAQGLARELRSTVRRRAQGDGARGDARRGRREARCEHRRGRHDHARAAVSTRAAGRFDAFRAAAGATWACNVRGGFVTASGLTAQWSVSAGSGAGLSSSSDHGLPARGRPIPHRGRSARTRRKKKAFPCLPLRAAMAACAAKKPGPRNASASATDSAALAALYLSRRPAEARALPLPWATQSSAMACAAARSSPWGTTLCTRPASRASAAVGFQPSGPSMRCAGLSPITRGKCTEEQPSGQRPRAAKGVWNVAFSDATMPSPSVAEVTDAPIAGPFTAYNKGLGKERNMSKRAVFWSMRVRRRAVGHMGLLTIAERSTPAQ
mmetsp:Transcript_4503/g.14954  ORF Transcript_4503/g.14954 Transcript_4503/m.14954 type:complete len:343 (+) Transcript_4503:917-1945(+)